MNDDLEGMLEHTQRAVGVWVAIDVVMETFGLERAAAYALAKSEGWRTSPGMRGKRRGPRPREYSFADIRVTWRRLNP